VRVEGGDCVAVRQETSFGGNPTHGPVGAWMDGTLAASRSASASRLGGTPNIRRYSRLNCEGLP
jgi:hypothetical protein